VGGRLSFVCTFKEKYAKFKKISLSILELILYSKMGILCHNMERIVLSL